jgi:hypothetical protein
VAGDERWEGREDGGRRWRGKKKISDVAFHIRLWRFGCVDLGVSVAALGKDCHRICICNDFYS